MGTVATRSALAMNRVAYRDAGKAYRAAMNRLREANKRSLPPKHRDRITPSDWAVMAVIGELTLSYSKLEDTVTMESLVRLSDLGLSTVSRSLNRLSRLGVISWKPDNSGTRFSVVGLLAPPEVLLPDATPVLLPGATNREAATEKEVNASKSNRASAFDEKQQLDQQPQAAAKKQSSTNFELRTQEYLGERAPVRAASPVKGAPMGSCDFCAAPGPTRPHHYFKQSMSCESCQTTIPLKQDGNTQVVCQRCEQHPGTQDYDGDPLCEKCYRERVRGRRPIGDARAHVYGEAAMYDESYEVAR
jgi:DNA-binding MarR family transcriptional regulator